MLVQRGTSVALGYNSVANANYATAIGCGANASTDAIALGYSASAAAFGAIAIGYTATCSGNSAIAIGNDSVCSSSESIAIGTGSSATGQHCCFRVERSCQFNNATALGAGANAARDAIALGYGASAAAFGADRDRLYRYL